jgi:hypothetical protein
MHQPCSLGRCRGRASGATRFRVQGIPPGAITRWLNGTDVRRIAGFSSLRRRPEKIGSALYARRMRPEGRAKRVIQEIPPLLTWIPACAGMTMVLGLRQCHSSNDRVCLAGVTGYTWKLIIRYRSNARGGCIAREGGRRAGVSHSGVRGLRGGRPVKIGYVACTRVPGMFRAALMGIRFGGKCQIPTPITTAPTFVGAAFPGRERLKGLENQALRR